MRSAASSCLRCLARTAPSQAPRPFPAELIPASKRLFHPPRTSSAIRPRIPLATKRPILSIVRHESCPSSPPAQQPVGSTQPLPSRLETDQVPAYEMTFTCKVCSTRSSHRVSKQGYHNGTVLIACPGCKNRHLISDHLKIFSDKPVTIEDLMREKGQLVKRGSLSTEGDVEFWDDGSTTPRSANFIPHPVDPNEGNKLTEPPKTEHTDGDSCPEPKK